MGVLESAAYHPNMKYQFAIVLALAALAHSMPNKQANQAIANGKQQAAEGLNAAQSWLDNAGIKFDIGSNLNTLLEAGKKQVNSQETKDAIQARVAQAQKKYNQGLKKIPDQKLRNQVRNLVNQGQNAVK